MNPKKCKFEDSSSNLYASSGVRRRDTTDYVAPSSGSHIDDLGNVEKPKPLIIESYPVSSASKWTRPDLQVNDVLRNIYLSGKVTDAKGIVHSFKDCVDPFEGRHLYELIVKNNFVNTLEVGLAMDASTTWICQAHADTGKNGKHIAIDPNQNVQYEGIGLYNVSRAGVSSHLSLMEFTSYRALPMLLEDIIAKRRPPFDMIFIDGWHTFDYTLIDFFYADLLLAVHGVIVIDDIQHKPVKKTLAYITKNYPHYEYIPNTPCASSMATLIKVAKDTRTWNHHIDF